MAKSKHITTYGTKRRRVDVDLTVDDMSWVPTSHSALQPTPLVAKQPPASQKAATMAVEPDADSINQLVSICGLDAATAARFLRAKQNDVNAAMNAVFDNESIEKLEEGTTWDEDVWHNTDRDGNTLRPLGASVPNTGRNSPAPSLGVINPKTKADEDRELETALAMSRGEGGFQQESGVVQQDGTHVQFGPATREQYDASQWALVPTYSAAQEIVPDLPSKERIQHGQEPRMLKHLPDGDYTPNLLTICHAIPKAKEAFLMREHVNADYGHDAEWWKGHAISLPRIVHTSDGSPAEPESDKYDELVQETQRLMAFLDSSERVYATIGGITNTDVIKSNNLQTTRSGTLLELFLQSWTMAAASKMGHDQAAIEQVASLFNTRVGTNGKDGMATPDLTVVDLSLKADEEDKDLFELLDNLLWDTNPNDPNRAENFVERPADIVVMKVAKAASSTSSLGLHVPSTLYLDRYLQQNVAATKTLRQEMMQGKARINKIEQIEKKLRSWQHPSKSAQIETCKLLEHTLGHYSGHNHKQADHADKSNNASLANAKPDHYSDVALQLEQIISSIDQKLRILGEEKVKTRKAVSLMSKADPPGLLEVEQKHRYVLRGVGTKPNITYVLQAKSEAEQHHEKEGQGQSDIDDENDNTPEGFQWWRLDYSTSGSSVNVQRTKSPDYEVIRAVELEHNSALLVYASEDAIDADAYSHEDMPAPLQTFIRRDNDHFARELSNEHPDPPAYSEAYVHDLSQIPRNSIERRDSMDSTQAIMNDLDDRDSPTLNGSPPEFTEDPTQHSGYGLGYGSKYDPDPVDIHLDPDDNLLGAKGTNVKEIEMIEKQHAPLVPGITVRAASAEDTAMGGTESQDMGVGGVTHVEDASNATK